MRLRRLSFIAGWAAVALLAAAGFAAFGTGEDPSSLEAQPVGANLGHDAGAYAGLAFAVLAGDTGPEDATQTLTAESGSTGGTETSDAGPSDPADSSAGTIATDGWLSQVQVRALVSEYFASEDVNQAVRVAWCESRFDPNSVNLRTGAVGLFQHLPKYWAERAANAGFPGADPTDPEASTAAAAWEVYNGAGWDIFACRG